MKPTGALSAKSRDWSWGHQADPSKPWLHLEILSPKVMNRISDKGQPLLSPTLSLTHYQETDQSHSQSCGTDTPFSQRIWGLPYDSPNGHVRMPSASPKNTCEWMITTVLLLNENHSAPPESKVLLSSRCSSPIPLNKPYQRGWGVWPNPVPLFKKMDHHPCLPIQQHCPPCPRDVAKSCLPQQPYTIQSLMERANLIQPRGLTTKFFSHLGKFSLGDTRACPPVPRPCFLTGRRVSRIEEVFEGCRS